MINVFNDSINDYHAFFCNNKGIFFVNDAIEILKATKDCTIDLIFADPPYNIKKAKWDNFQSPNMYVNWSIEWIRECSRILKPTGSLYICGFSENLADLKSPSMAFFAKCRWLVWHYRNKANLGTDWGRSHESILHLRKNSNFRLNIDEIRIPYNEHTLKYPARFQAASSQYGAGGRAAWTPHPLGAKPKDVFEIPVLCNGTREKTAHPTQKPEALLEKLLLAASRPGDIVLDPFSGSGTTLVVAERLGRYWIGCENNREYASLFLKRIRRPA